jgi:TPP-dependent 2-oxoacid decarboxylase
MNRETRMVTVAHYVIERLAKLGITECFGVPGDFSFPLTFRLCTVHGNYIEIILTFVSE